MMSRKTDLREVVFVALLLMMACGPKAASPAPEVEEAPPSSAETVSVTLPITGMHCEGCETMVKGVLEKLEGVASAEPSAASALAVVVYDPAKVTPEKLAEEVNTQTEYKASIPSAVKQ